MIEIIDKIFGYGSVIIAILLILALISLPTVIAYNIHCFLKKKGIKYIGTLLLIVAPMCFVMLQ